MVETRPPQAADLAELVRAALVGLVGMVLLVAAGWGTSTWVHSAGVSTVAAVPLPPSHWLTLLTQRWVPFSASLALLVVGAFYLSFWLARRREREHLLLAVTTVVWAVFNLQYVLPDAAAPRVLGWQTAATELLPIPWLNALIYLFIAHLVPPQRRALWLERLLPWYVVLYSLAVLPWWPWSGTLGLLPVWMYTAVGITSVATIMWMLATQGRLERWVMQAACAYCILAAANDLLLIQGLVAAPWPYLVPYTGLILLGSFTFALQRRYVDALEAVEQSQEHLGRQLALREAELKVQHERVIRLERAQVQLQERQRLMRDIHDGVGGTLTTSLMLAEQGALAQGEMVNAMRHAVDDLRVLIDSMDPAGTDLGALLANLRHRLHARFEAAGVALHWSIAPGAEVCPLPSSTRLHLLRWLQEALTNALKHAQASSVTVSLQLQSPPATLQLSVVDNGQGFDTGHGTASAGRGLGHLRQRAQVLGARFELHTSRNAGTRLSLALPL